MSQLQRRKKQKLTKETLKSTIENQEKWQVPYSMISNLESSVQSLISSNNSLQSTLHLLDSATKDFTRHCEFAKHDRLYEVVTESDIRSAQLEISKDVLPELEQLLSEADQLLGLLQVQEKESKQKVEEQQQILSHLRTAVKFATSQSKILSNTKVNKNKESASSAVLNQLKDKQKRLKLLIDVEDRKIKEETIELKGLQKEILQLEKEMEQVIPSDNGSELIIDKDKHKLELIQQLADLKQQTIKKKESYEEKQQIEASRASNSSSIQIKETQLNTLAIYQLFSINSNCLGSNKSRRIYNVRSYLTKV
ncbi:Spc19-domain-containing protein [Cokeromyces recurvatus]|uniref:Spc19-domain-containing protein n=1 Tax=Cokeromyces recurvatus TaxID=90255 RepID=UPI00222025E2|nr:Spc19-domain-containing protein [Cokeromyces recurvatus]KAI7905356.1 Spc19-domain-containing protein [Cokeromyces recurvatus]